MRVHETYIDYLTTGHYEKGGTGSTTTGPVTQEPWYGAQIQRSRWHDLFKAEDRVELLRGIWGIVNYLMRVTEGEEGVGDGEASSK